MRRRYLSIEGLRQAIAQVVDATWAARLPHIRGEGTTACASDSKQFGAWDQNLLTEWHHRQAYPNLDLVLAARSIDWELIEQQLDAMVKHAVDMKRHGRRGRVHQRTNDPARPRG